MYFSNLLKTQISIIKKEIISSLRTRTITTGRPTLKELEEEEVEQGEEEEEGNGNSNEQTPRRITHPLETCIEYLESDAYKTTYGDKPVWTTYVRNFKGGFPPRTRRSCWKFGKLNRASPCPICRDEYLLPHYLNVKLISQFISPWGGQILDSKKTGVCQKQQFLLEVAIAKARNYGLLTFTVPHRIYDYSLYNKK